MGENNPQMPYHPHETAQVSTVWWQMFASPLATDFQYRTCTVRDEVCDDEVSSGEASRMKLHSPLATDHAATFALPHNVKLAEPWVAGFSRGGPEMEENSSKRLRYWVCFVSFNDRRWRNPRAVASSLAISETIFPPSGSDSRWSPSSHSTVLVLQPPL